MHVCASVRACVGVCATVSVVPLRRGAARNSRGGDRCAATGAATAPPVAFDPPSGFALAMAVLDSCPSGTAPVLTPAKCDEAAAAAAKAYRGSVRVTGLPAGCVWLTAGEGSFFFNDEPGGIHSSFFKQPVCAAVCAAGAPEF